MALARTSFLIPDLCSLSFNLGAALVFSVHKNIFAPDLDLVAIDTYGWVLYDLSCRNIVLPAVPGAGHHVSAHSPLPKRPAPMEASVVNGVVFAADIGQSHSFPFNLELADSTRRNLIRFCRSYQRHQFLPRFFTDLRSPISTLVPASGPPLRPF